MSGGVPKNVRVAEGQFSDLFFNHIVDGEALFLTGELGMKNDLEQNVAQFLLHIRIVLFTDRGFELFSFLEKVADQAGMGLFLVPGAPFGRPQFGDDFNELIEGFHEVLSGGLHGRKGWDSNPRGAYAPAAFRERYLQPLGHPSARATSSKFGPGRKFSAGFTF
jgi:hypothetical protein